VDGACTVRVGDLVRVYWRGFADAGHGLGQVLRIDPDHYGGTSLFTSNWGRSLMTYEVSYTPKRARVLVLLYDDGGMSWWDEQSLEPFGGRDDV